MNAIVLMATAVLAAQVASPPPLAFTIEAVKGKVVLTHAGSSRRATAGAAAQPGDELRTDSRGRALLAVNDRASRFEVYPDGELQLAGPDPGVLVVLRRGRVKAYFEPGGGPEERLIGAPGGNVVAHDARCGLEVDADGNGVLVVFAGSAEVRPIIVNLPPLRVGPGELCRFGPRIPPSRTALPRGFTEEGWDRSGAPAS